VGLHYFADGACQSELGFQIANNYTDAGGDNTHQLDHNIDPQEPSYPTLTAHQGNVLETSFDLSLIPEEARSVWFHPYTQSFDWNDEQTGHDHSLDSPCFRLPGAD
jgi:hypothetical protein